LSYKLKTLIVFDTNSLRKTDSGEVLYSSFSFGKPYEVINEYITANNLHGDVILAVSALVIDEIKLQMERSYAKDLQKLKDTKRRLSGLPHITEELIGIPQEEFNCFEYVEQKSGEYLRANNYVRLLSYKEEQSKEILAGLINRVHNSKPPFFKTTQHSDAGFKDSVIWETLLHYDEVENFNKVILFTKDKGFEGCEEEFIAKWNRHFKIITAPEAVNTEIGIDYENYIKERAIHDFAQSEYFIGYLNDELNAKSLIMINEIEQPIRGIAIMDSCNFVNRLPPNEEGIENISVGSIILVKYKWDDETKEQEVKALTLLEDDETKQIISTEFDFELL
jgi:PIN domain